MSQTRSLRTRQRFTLIPKGLGEQFGIRNRALTRSATLGDPSGVQILAEGHGLLEINKIAAMRTSVATEAPGGTGLPMPRRGRIGACPPSQTRGWGPKIIESMTRLLIPSREVAGKGCAAGQRLTVESKIAPLGRKDSQVPDGFTSRRDEEHES